VVQTFWSRGHKTDLLSRVRLAVAPPNIDVADIPQSANTLAGIPPTKTLNCHSVLFANASFLGPVRASFRDNRPLRWIRVLHTASILRSTARRVIGE